LPKFHELVERHAGAMPPYKEIARLYDTFGMRPI